MVNIEASNGVCHARVIGEMTIYHAAEMKGELLPCLERAAELEIDLSEVSEIDTAGLQLLLMVKREAVSVGKTLRLTGYSDSTMELLELSGPAFPA